MRLSLSVILAIAGIESAAAATTLWHYYAHDAVADQHGVIAPWYKAQNGQYDFRVRIAAETLKRYPWATADRAPAPAPEYVYNGLWNIDHDGNIVTLHQQNQNNGDLAQRAVFVISGLLDYYQYSGDASAITPITAFADHLINNCQTGDTGGWPRMLISVPCGGTLYGKCQVGPPDAVRNKHGMIQLDLVAQSGLELLRAYQMLGHERWYSAVKHWADLLAKNRNRREGTAPWGRYAASDGSSGMNDIQTGGIGIVLRLFDQLIRMGYTGENNSLLEARNAGREHLKNVLLPAWLVRDTWGRNYWDWEASVQDLVGTECNVLYMMENPDYFPNWKTDVRNILTLFINHASVNPGSGGDVFHGAWAYPEANNCCNRSLWYSPMKLAGLFAQYGVLTGSEWASEIARRSQLLATYDPLGQGHSRDTIDGGVRVNSKWFKIAHPMALKHVLRSIGWQPEIMGANRENHLVRTTSVVRNIVYGKGRITYTTFSAPANSVDVLRLAFAPASVTAGGRPLTVRTDLSGNGYVVRALPGGDHIVSIRHDGATEITLAGADPQTEIDAAKLSLAGGVLTFKFHGNQVRLVGRVGPAGGLADVYIDDFKQLVPVDFHSPAERSRQILYYRNGLPQGPHTLKLAARGQGNPLSKGTETNVEAVQFSDATGDSGFGEGGGPAGVQRMIFGYPKRTDYVDAKGQSWMPAGEFIVRTGQGTDSVAKTWWTNEQAVFIRNSPDPELYLYGVHWTGFTVNVTVGPGVYYARLKFAETQYRGPSQRAMSIYLQGRKVVEGFDVFATAGGPNRATDLVFNEIRPKNGVIEIGFVGDAINAQQKEAIVQAIEVGPGDGGKGDTPKTATSFQPVEIQQ